MMLKSWFFLSATAESLSFQRQFSLVFATPHCETNLELTSMFIYDFVSTVTGSENNALYIIVYKHSVCTGMS